ncbi:MAG: 50S ribosomal protein L25 [Chloroflexi bacterium]|nr:MAG: 50S ribosomal protein L25 [Chloroflexota bacterium]
MPTARPTLAATRRDVLGKKVADLRRSGKLPAVVFGHGEESAPVTVNAHEFDLLRRRVGATTLIDVSVDGGAAKPALIRSVQIDLIRRRPIHADLFLVRMTEELTVDVQIVVTGTSEAVEKLGGTLSHLDHLRVRGLPDHLPERVVLPIDSLVDFDSAIHVRDLEFPSDVTLLTDVDEVAAKVLPPRIEIEEAPPAEEVEEGEEGEAAEEGGEPTREGAREGAPTREGASSREGAPSAGEGGGARPSGDTKTSGA